MFTRKDFVLLFFSKLFILSKEIKSKIYGPDFSFIHFLLYSLLPALSLSLSPSLSLSHTHTHTRKHTHLYPHTYTHTHTHIYIYLFWHQIIHKIWYAIKENNWLTNYQYPHMFLPIRFPTYTYVVRQFQEAPVVYTPIRIHIFTIYRLFAQSAGAEEKTDCTSAEG